MAVNTLARIREQVTGTDCQKYIKDNLGSKAQEFTAALLSLVSGNPTLQECTTKSLMTTAMKAAVLDLPLDPNLGMAYPIPYDNSKKHKDAKTGEWVVDDKIMECQLQIGAKGFTQLAIRSSQFKTINVRDVRQGEIVGEDFISGTLQFKQLPIEERLQAPIVGYLAYFELLSGFSKMMYMTIEECLDHATRYSQSYKNDLIQEKKYGAKYVKKSLWATDTDAMCSKTVLKLLISKYAPLSVQMQKAIIEDQSAEDEEGRKYIDNEKDVETAVEVEVAEEANKEHLPEEKQEGGGETLFN